MKPQDKTKLLFWINFFRWPLVVLAIAAIVLFVIAWQASAVDNTDRPHGVPFDRYMYGLRISGKFYEWRNGVQHKAWDMALPSGTPLIAPMSGEVTVMWDYTAGAYILITNGPWKIGLLHLSRVEVKNLVKGNIKQGELIAYSGNSGFSTGPHVHYFIEKDGVRMNPNDFQ